MKRFYSIEIREPKRPHKQKKNHNLAPIPNITGIPDIMLCRILMLLYYICHLLNLLYIPCTIYAILEALQRTLASVVIGGPCYRCQAADLPEEVGAGARISAERVDAPAQGLGEAASAAPPESPGFPFKGS